MMINRTDYFPFYFNTKKKPEILPKYDFTSAITTTATANYNKRSFNDVPNNPNTITTTITKVCSSINNTEVENYSPWKRRRMNFIHDSDTDISTVKVIEEKLATNDDQDMEYKKKVPSLSKTLIWKNQALQKSSTICSSANKCFICNYQPNHTSSMCSTSSSSSSTTKQSTLTNYFSIQTSSKPIISQKRLERTLDKCTFCDQYSCSNECNSTCAKCNDIFCNFCCRKKYYKNDVYVVCLECDVDNNDDNHCAKENDDAMCLD